MKIFLDAYLFLWILVMGCNIHEASSAFELLLSCGNSVVNGSDCTMTCDTKDPTATAIQWLNGSATTAVETVDCTDAGDLPYESSCNTPGKFDLKITNAQYGRDSYAWSCASPFGGETSNVTDGNTFVTVNLTRVTLTRPTATSISCVAVSSPAANVTLYEGSPPSQDYVVKTETSFTKTMDGLETQLTSTVEESKTYYCRADNGGGGGGVDSRTSLPVADFTYWLIIIIIILVLLVLLVIIYHLVIFIVRVSIIVMVILFFVNVVLAVVAVVIGIVVCVLYIVVVELTLAIIVIVIGFLTLIYKIFFSKHVLEKAGVPHRHLFGRFFAYPCKEDAGCAPRGANPDAPANTPATVVTIGESSSGNSRGTRNQETVPPTHKTMNSHELDERKDGNKETPAENENVNIPALGLQSNQGNAQAGNGNNDQTENSKSENGEKKKGSKKKKSKKSKKKNKEIQDGTQSPPAVSVSGVAVDDPKTVEEPEEKKGSESNLTRVVGPNTEMKNTNDHKKDEKKDEKKNEKKDDKKDDKKEDKEKKDDKEKEDESDDPPGRPLPPRTTQKTSDLPSPKQKMKPKEGSREELKPLRDAPRGVLPSPRVSHNDNDNDSASSASNVTPHVL